jgi:arylsulfatase A-like enzyme
MPADTPPDAAPLKTLFLAVTAALLTAAVHLAIVVVRRDVLHELLWTWWARDQVRVTPLAYLVAFAPLAALLLVLHLAFRRRVALPVVAGALSAFGTFAVLLLFPRIAPVAWMVVALGVGVQVARAWGRHPEAAWRVTRRTGALLLAGFLVLGVRNAWTLSMAERQALAAHPPAATTAPNVLILILDTVRASSMSLYGAADSTTPSIDARAREGVVFDAAFSTAPWTLPSHASMFTGRYASEQSGDWQTPLDGRHRTLAEVFRDRGYATGGFVANFLAAGYRSGLSRGFARYEDTRHTFTETALNSTLAQTSSVASAWRVWRHERWLGKAVRNLLTFNFHPFSTLNTHDPKPATLVADEFLDWQEGLGGRPFLAFLNFFDAHAPYEPPAPYDTAFEPRGRAYGRYKGGIRYMDDQVGRLLQELARRGVLDHTIVVITADHGELFGEHGLTGHGNAVYLPLLHVPLVIRAPALVPAGVRVPQPVSLRDLAATLLDLAGATDEHGLPGVSLRTAFTGATTHPGSPLLSEVSAGVNDQPKNPTYQADLKSVFDDTMHVIVSSKGPVERYAWRSDPDEATNLATSSPLADAARGMLERVLREQGLRWRPDAGKPVRGGTVAPP